MYSATLYFERSVDVDDLLNGLLNLPEPIKPIYFSQSELRKGKLDLVSNKERFSEFFEVNKIGFFLHAQKRTIIDVSIGSVGYISVTMYCNKELPSEHVLAFFGSCADCKPIFGFACSDDEYDHRNRYYISTGEEHIEDWIGRKLQNYVSGVYWYTFFSDSLLNRHDVSLAELSAEAISIDNLDKEFLHLLNFYEHPDQWQSNAERLDDLCEKSNGVFSKRCVELAVQGVKNLMEYDEVITNWR